VAACLAKDPKQRPQSTAEIATRLQLDAPRRDWARPMTSTRPRKKALALLGIATLFVIGLAGFYFGVLQRQGKPLAAPAAQTASPPATISEKSIAVLPFENRSEDKANAYFADGIQDEILTRLAKIGDLKVISRTSTEKYRGHPGNLKKVAEELGVAAFLEGSVQKTGGKVRVTVQLIEAMSDHHLWAETYDRPLDDIFTVQSEIAGQVASALHASLTPQESVALKSVPTRNQKAYDLFLRAEHFLRIGRQDNASALQEAIPLYRQAIAEDPRFALAYAQLSFAQSLLRWMGAAPADVSSDQERTDADKALALQPELVQAHLALAFCDYVGRLDYPSALEHLARAQALAPQSAEVLRAFGAVYRRQLRFDEAIAAYERAAQYDPGNSQLFSNLATTCLWAGRNDKVQPNLERALTLDPTHVMAANLLGFFLLQQRGDVEGARRVFRSAGAQLELAYTYWVTRDYEKATQLIEELPAASDVFESSSGGSKDEQLGLALHWAGHNERARSLLEPERDRLTVLLAKKTLSPSTVMFNAMLLAQIELALGNWDAAVQVAERGAQSDAVTRDAIRREYYRSDLAEIYARAGRKDEAIALISGLLKAGSGFTTVTPIMLRLAPTWDPLREDPRFQALLKEYPAEGGEKAGKQ